MQDTFFHHSEAEKLGFGLLLPAEIDENKY